MEASRLIFSLSFLFPVLAKGSTPMRSMMLGFLLFAPSLASVGCTSSSETTKVTPLEDRSIYEAEQERINEEEASLKGSV